MFKEISKIVFALVHFQMFMKVLLGVKKQNQTSSNWQFQTVSGRLPHLGLCFILGSCVAVNNFSL